MSMNAISASVLLDLARQKRGGLSITIEVICPEV